MASMLVPKLENKTRCHITWYMIADIPEQKKRSNSLFDILIETDSLFLIMLKNHSSRKSHKRFKHNINFSLPAYYLFFLVDVFGRENLRLNQNKYKPT